MEHCRKQFKCKNQTFLLVTYVLEIHPLRMKFARLFDSAFCFIWNVIKKCLTVYIVHEEGPCREETQLKPPSKKVKILPPKKASRSSPRISCSIFRHDNDQFSSCLPFDSLAEQAIGNALVLFLDMQGNICCHGEGTQYCIAKTCHGEGTLLPRLATTNTYRNVYFRQGLRYE